MLTYEPVQLSIGSVEYLLLPKLVPLQMQILAARLSSVGFRVSGGPVITGRRQGQVIRVGQAGLCWSNGDPSDAIAPAIPDLLRVEKRPARASTIVRMYLQETPSGGSTSYRLRPRVESGPLWTKLRGAGTCGLAPDEQAILKAVFASAEGYCSVLTDFPVQGSEVRMIGHRQYYDSFLSCSEASATLRVAGKRGVRNSYLLKDAGVSLGAGKRLSRLQWIGVLKDLGQWCYFDPY